jgi:hypothetical protein
MSTADAAHVTTTPTRLVVRTVRAVGTLSVGAVRSTTVTKKVAVAVSPVAAAVHETTVVPSGNVEPEDGVQLAGIVPRASSTAVTA